MQHLAGRSVEAGGAEEGAHVPLEGHGGAGLVLYSHAVANLLVADREYEGVLDKLAPACGLGICDRKYYKYEVRHILSKLLNAFRPGTV